MARRLYASAFCEDFVLLYPVYALLFADAGLSAAQISSLFIVWSVTSFVLEVPSGLLADTVSRRRLLTVAPLLTGAGYALWTFAPAYPSFAVGFVLWGAGGALRSGALEALVYEELARVGAHGRYARLIGRSRAVGTTAVMAATALAAPVMAEGGYLALGLASVAVTLLGAVVAWSLPESRAPGKQEEQGGAAETLRGGLAEVRRGPAILGALVLLSVLTGIVGALDEYLPLLARAGGAPDATVPLLLLPVMAGVAVGVWFAGRGTRWAAPALAAAALCLAVGALSGHPAGMLGVAAAFGIVEWAGVAVEARLQTRLTDRARATVTSLAGVGAETVGVLVYAAYAFGSLWTGPPVLFAVAAGGYLLVALALRRAG